jgi:hypothetical protein
MPWSSLAQKRKFSELVRDGKITQREYDRWDKETGKRKLPERVTKPKGK